MKCEKCIFKIPFLPIPWFSRPAQIGILEVSTRERMRRKIAVASGSCTYFLGLNTYYYSSRPCAIVDKYSLFHQFWLFCFVQNCLEWKWHPCWCKRCQYSIFHCSNRFFARITSVCIEFGDEAHIGAIDARTPSTQKQTQPGQGHLTSTVLDWPSSKEAADLNTAFV